ncbi:MAG: hypothetical protein A2787_05085 [Omnitrophica WOR_2 bacterium RIFCSPHIGHO2_01_FULL_48_9]|nr:MAG: hypothetical protein A3D10_01640 [Omnitrophica WOR_2 bacterium RIFCSPHIGHO2_02_FULL_48_11]OGX33989.1 MAG: hypothetical protein A2787_05085 [Omnitrophica WOR_2 bacterium RIFCSPHIGHO2_01_FULL_48_9]
MPRNKKYDVSGLVETQFEPGSGGRVLRNLLRIKNKREIDHREARDQLRAVNEVSKLFAEDHRFTAEDICHIHRIWLGRIYSWAGQYRQVNISKDGFSFAAARHIPALMEEFEKGALFRFTPCRGNSRKQIVQALAVVHTELVLIHPFREGNGRMARLLSVVMGWQAQLPTLNFGGITGKKKTEYFAAVRAGVERNYKPMEEIFGSIIKRTLKNAPKR